MRFASAWSNANSDGVIATCADSVSYSTMGATGYHFAARLPWLDALLNAAMILAGMGPVDQLTTSEAKLFATLYALYSGLVFLVVAGILLGPVIHRVLHRFHLEDRDAESS